MTTTADPLTPGLYRGLDEATYHADPALSSSGAKTLLKCPALFDHHRKHGRPPKRAFDVGSAAHRMVLGAGAPLARIPAGDYRTKRAKLMQRVARAFDWTPVLAHEHDHVSAMAEALRADPIAAALLDPASGDPEVSIVWDDPATGVRCRIRLDFLPHLDARDRLIVVDYKTTQDASDDACERSIGRFRYHIQEGFYVDGVAAHFGIDTTDIAFVFVFQETEPPYLVNIGETPWDARRAGQHAAHRAREIFAECSAAGTWPGYSTGKVSTFELKPWTLKETEEL